MTILATKSFPLGACVNDAQRSAITFDGSGPLLVLAGPGSGKTFVITQRVRFLIEEKKVPPEKILVLTFTRDAANSMKNRFLNMGSSVKQENVSQAVKQINVSRSVNFGTFHSIFYQILKQSINLQDKQILTDAEKKKFLQPVIHKAMPNLSYLERNNLWLELLPAISFYKNTGRGDHATKRLSREAQEKFPEIFKAYENERRNAGKIDFDDMLTDCRRLLEENPSMRAYWQKRFDEILIDEFQDINPAQYEILKLLAMPRNHVFAVGDDDQSIYGFRGAEPACMKQFETEFHAQTILLNVNYRSTQAIVEGSQRLIKHNQRRYAKKIMADPGKPGKGMEILKKGFQDKLWQMEYVSKICKDHQKKGEETLAILFRTNKSMQKYANYLKQSNLPFSMREKMKDMYQDEYVKDVCAYLKLSRNENDLDSLLRIMNRPSRFISREVVMSLEQRKPEEYVENKSNIDFLAQYYKEMRSDTYERVLRLKENLKSLKKLSPFTAIQYVRRIIGYETWLLHELENSEDKKNDALDSLAWLTREAERSQSVEEFLNGSIQKQTGKTKDDRNGQNIFLMTIHAAKGLEFDKVLIPDVNENIFPHGTMLDNQVLEEERRIFYVGMTRAKKELELLYIKEVRGNGMHPSRFLNET